VGFVKEQLAALSEVAREMHKCVRLEAEMASFKEEASLEVRLGVVLGQRLRGESGREELLQAWGADYAGRLTIDGFRKYPLQMRSMGDFQPRESLDELKRALDELFTSLGGRFGLDEQSRLDFRRALDEILAAADSYTKVEEELGLSQAKAAAKALQVEFVAREARHLKEGEIAERKRREHDLAAEAARAEALAAAAEAARSRAARAPDARPSPAADDALPGSATETRQDQASPEND
jgi:hypothetical protein